MRRSTPSRALTPTGRVPKLSLTCSTGPMRRTHLEVNLVAPGNRLGSPAKISRVSFSNFIVGVPPLDLQSLQPPHVLGPDLLESLGTTFGGQEVMHVVQFRRQYSRFAHPLRLHGTEEIPGCH